LRTGCMVDSYDCEKQHRQCTKSWSAIKDLPLLKNFILPATCR
jgi:hypothetical protein